MRARAVVGLVAALLVVSCGGDEAKSGPGALPPGVIALVDGYEITKAELDREFAFRGGGLTGTAGEAARQRIFDTLLMKAAIRHEGARRGISVPKRIVDDSVLRLRRNGPGGRERMRHLHDEDIARTVINNQIIARLAKSDSPPKWLATQDESMLLRRWRDRIVCRAGYRSVGCGD